MSEKEELGHVVTPPPGGSVSFHRMNQGPHQSPLSPVQATQAGPAVTVIPGQAPPAQIAHAPQHPSAAPAEQPPQPPAEPTPGAGAKATPPDGGTGGGGEPPAPVDRVETLDEDDRAHMAYARHAGNPLTIEIRGAVTIVSPSAVQVIHAVDPESGAEVVQIEAAEEDPNDDNGDDNS